MMLIFNRVTVHSLFTAILQVFQQFYMSLKQFAVLSISTTCFIYSIHVKLPSPDKNTVIYTRIYTLKKNMQRKVIALDIVKRHQFVN